MRSEYIELNRLYKRDKKLAINKTNSEMIDIKLSLQTFSTDFLRDLGLWDNNLKHQIAHYNTKRYYTNYRILDIKYRLLDYINESKSSDCDYLLSLDLGMSLNTNTYLLDLTKFIKILSNQRVFNLEYVKLIKDTNKYLFYDFIYQNTDLYKYLASKDQELVSDKELNIKLLGTDVNELALNRIDYLDLYKYREFIDDDYIKNNFSRFKLNDLLLIRDQTFIWGVLKNESYKFRYAIYNRMNFTDKAVKIVRQDIKNLVKSNYKQIADKFKSHISDTISIIKEMVDQVVIFPVLADLIYLVISELEEISKDICMFYILKYINSKEDFTDGESFCKWYINTIRLLRLFYKDVDYQGLQDLIDEYIRNKRYSAILLVELTQKCSCLTDINEVYLYENYNIKLKDDIFERYQKITGINTPPKCDIKYLTVLEVNKLQTDRFDYQYYEDYLFVRNLARLVTNNMSRIKDFSKVADFFLKCVQSNEEDIKLIGNSMISKIEVFTRK
ncbi:hypothetical protein P3W45_001537 [Vairimorpha bombi]|jgi:hypothetical protein